MTNQRQTNSRKLKLPVSNGMKWGFFLHFYQPYNQQADILERIVNESYRQVIGGLSFNPKMKITLNINAGLTELLVKNGYSDVVENIKTFAKRGQIEFTGGVKYHPFLPLLPKQEIKRQIELNEETNKKYFGKFWRPRGFFSPELAYNKEVAQIAKECGFGWILAEELASPEKPDFKKIYNIKDIPDFKVVFRNKRISVLILSAIVRHFKSFIQEIGEEEIKKDSYVLTVMDAETFGHHRPGLGNFLFQIYSDRKISKVFVSDLVQKFAVGESIEPRNSTWSSEEQDFWLGKEKEHSFTLWRHPQNPIHHQQWEFVYFTIDLVNNLSKESPAYQEIREKLDRALQSDQFWWASAKPWWSLEMIEQGAFILKDVVLSIPGVSLQNKKRAEEYYRRIIDLAFERQRSGKIRRAYQQALETVKQRPYQKRVLAGQFNSIILEFENEMDKAVKDREFEKAIKWRDAIYKLKSGLDVYDVLHVVDDLRRTRFIPSLKDYWEHAPGEFSKFAKKHFIGFKQEKFRKKQPKQLFNEIRKAFKEKNKKEHPLGFSWDNYNNFYLCEIPSKEIEYWLGEYGWDAMSLIKFKQRGSFHQPGQCFYQYGGKKIKIRVGSSSLISSFLKLLKNNDTYQGKWLKLAILSEGNKWSPVFFKKNKQGELVAQIVYRLTEQGQGFKFKVSGFVPQILTTRL